MKKKDNKKTGKEIVFNNEQRQQLMRMAGFAMALIGKGVMEQTGLVCDFKINGEDINDLEKLHELDIQEKLKLAISEERYEDAVKLKRLIDSKK